MRLVEADPEEERPGAGGVQERRERLRNLRRVPLKLPLGVGAVMGLRHVPGEVALLLEEKRQDALSFRKWRVQVLSAYSVRVPAGQGADSGGAALRSGAKGILHPEPRRGQPVDVWCPDEAVAVRAGVAPAEIVADKHDDVGPSIVRWWGEDS